MTADDGVRRGISKIASASGSHCSPAPNGFLCMILPKDYCVSMQILAVHVFYGSSAFRMRWKMLTFGMLEAYGP